MDEKECCNNNIALKPTEEAELPSLAYGNPQVINDGWKNIGFTIAFWIHTLIVIFIAVILGQPAILYYTTINSNESFKQIALLDNIELIFHALTAATITGILLSFIVFFTLQLCTGRIIKCSFIFTITIQVSITFIVIIVLLWPAYVTMCVTLLIPIIIALIVTTIYFFYVHGRIQFAEAHLRIACAILRCHSSIILVALSMLVIQVLWFTVWYIMVIGVHHAMSGLSSDLNLDMTTTISMIIHNATDWNETKQDLFNTTFRRTENNMKLFRNCLAKIGRGHGSLIIEFVLLYSFYWGAVTFRNIMHFITACTVGQWWFENDTSRQYSMKTSFKRAFTTNFGTIAFGSLFVSIVRGLRFCIQHDKSKTNIVRDIVGCCASCIIIIIEKFFGYISRWGFNYAALTGQDFADASRSSIELFEKRGWMLIIHDDLVGTAMTIITFTIGLASATAGGLIFYTFTPNSSSKNDFTIHIAFISYIVGASMSTIMTSILTSSARTIFICFALNPMVLSSTQPTCLKNLVKVWHKFNPEALASNGYTTDLSKLVSAENV